MTCYVFKAKENQEPSFESESDDLTAYEEDNNNKVEYEYHHHMEEEEEEEEEESYEEGDWETQPFDPWVELKHSAGLQIMLASQLYIINVYDISDRILGDISENL